MVNEIDRRSVIRRRTGVSKGISSGNLLRFVDRRINDFWWIVTIQEEVLHTLGFLREIHVIGADSTKAEGLGEWDAIFCLLRMT